MSLISSTAAGQAAVAPGAGPALRQESPARLPESSVRAQGRGQDSPGRAGRFVILLDAAHGGDDGGAHLADGTAEKTLMLALSVRLRSLLAARGFQVMTTREGNVSVDANTRAQIANHAAAAACLSLHASESGSGVHIYVSSLETIEPARFLAWKTAQAAFVTRSLKLASVVNSAFEHASVPGAANGGGDAGPVPVLLARTALPGVDSMTCPAVALEFAPIRGADGKVVTEVTDPQYQTQIVETLAAALLEWKTDSEADAHANAPAGRLP